MRIDEKKLKFYVLLFEPNRKEAEMYNIFDNLVVREDILEALKKKISKEDLRETLYRTCKYVFWSRCEYEIVVTGFPIDTKSQKIDAWFQIEPNIDVITEYLWKEFLEK